MMENSGGHGRAHAGPVQDRRKQIQRNRNAEDAKVLVIRRRLHAPGAYCSHPGIAPQSRNSGGNGSVRHKSGACYGVSIPSLRKIAREAGKNHALAQMLWDSRIHEGRILASMIGVPSQLTDEQMESWAKDFDSWDVCDQCCNNLFRKAGIAHRKTMGWSARSEEFVKRAGFTLMAASLCTTRPQQTRFSSDICP